MNEMVYFYPEGHADHFERGHPERPDRVEAAVKALQQAGWWDDFTKVIPDVLPMSVLHAVHSEAYLNVLEMSCRRDGHLDADTYTRPASWELAQHAAGGAVAVTRAVWKRDARRGFALTRPPGHHATRGRGMGFCLLNNIALAAEAMIQGEGAQRLAIIDLDLHHGNGTQEIFYTRGDVFYMSTHQSPLYPGSGFLDDVGEGSGEGRTANFPLPPGAGDEAFLTVMDELIVPLLDGFSPQMLLVSYGFDTHWSDPLGSLALSAGGYGMLIERLAGWADAHCEGRLALFLEGGYDLDAAAACTQSVVAALLGMPWTDALGSAPFAPNQAWRNMVQRARQLWDL
ncbi:MAG: histone deacetylase [Anaerolineales bacterium]|nr:histone deacetylase [Anaerolineales bacterium]